MFRAAYVYVYVLLLFFLTKLFFGPCTDWLKTKKHTKKSLWLIHYLLFDIFQFSPCRLLSHGSGFDLRVLFCFFRVEGRVNLPTSFCRFTVIFCHLSYYSEWTTLDVVDFIASLNTVFREPAALLFFFSELFAWSLAGKSYCVGFIFLDQHNIIDLLQTLWVSRNMGEKNILKQHLPVKPLLLDGYIFATTKSRKSWLN